MDKKGRQEGNTCLQVLRDLLLQARSMSQSFGVMVQRGRHPHQENWPAKTRGLTWHPQRLWEDLGGTRHKVRMASLRVGNVIFNSRRELHQALLYGRSIWKALASSSTLPCGAPFGRNRASPRDIYPDIFVARLQHGGVICDKPLSCCQTRLDLAVWRR